MIFLSLILIFNLWIWKVFLSNPALGILLIITTCYLYFYGRYNRRINVVLISIFFSLLLYFQVTTSDEISLTNLDNDEQRVVQMRLREEKPIHIPLGSKNIWIYQQQFLENNPFLTAFTRTQNNFFENLDLNQYFFAGHPRERITVKEFEKFPYLYLPFFLGGLYLLVKKKFFIPLSLSILTLLTVSFFGNKNALGPFILFPVFTLAIVKGHEAFFVFVNKMKMRRIIFAVWALVFTIIFLQTVIYAFS